MEASIVQPRRPRRFWALLTFVGVLTPALVGCVFSAVFISYFAINSFGKAISGSLIDVVTDRLLSIVVSSKFSLILAANLVPLTAVAVPASYKAAVFDRKTKPSLGVFVWFMTLFGFIGPLVLGFVQDILPLPPNILYSMIGLSFFYAFFGLFVAPLTALILWPLIRRLDHWFGIGAPRVP